MAAPLTDSELQRLRAATPALHAAAHFAHGSCSLPPACVFAAQRAWLDEEERDGPTGALHRFDGQLQAVRATVAQLIGAGAHQIALAESSSRAWALAFAAACAGDRPVGVIATEHEWSANAMNVLQARQQGRIAGLQVLYDDGTTPAAQQVASRLAAVPPAHMPLVALQAVNPVDGSVTDLSGVADAVHRRGGLLFLDASHAVGQLPVNVDNIGCDVMVFPARKWLRGPKGVSVLYLSDRALARLGAPPSLDIASAVWNAAMDCTPHPDRRRFESHAFHPGLRLGLQAACNHAMALGVDRIAAHNLVVREQVHAALDGIPALRAMPARAPSALMTYRIQAPLAAQLLARLTAEDIHASLITTQYARWALAARGLSVLLRLTPHYLTSDADITHLRAVLAGLPAQFSLVS